MFIRTDSPGVRGGVKQRELIVRRECQWTPDGRFLPDGQTSPRLAGATEDSRLRVIYQIYLRELILSAGGRDSRRR